uniref:DUF4371 domain-containing protein n=1 Tax=Sinocyclocheilus rhinocerous TaxID=307959 RepID=A0A673H3J0_9TELE
MKPSHLQRHLRTKHPHQVGNSLEFFRRTFHEFTSCQENMKKATSASAKALEASYAVSLLLAKAKKPFSLAEELIIPAAAVLAETMLDKTAADKIKTVPLSNDTVSRRIDKMGTDIVDGQAQLVAFARYVDTSDIREHILFCKTLEERTTGEDIFNIVNSFFSEHEIRWKSCTSVCTDAAASMTGRIKGLIAHIRQKNPDILWTHCVIHREARASKKMSPDLNSVLNDAVKAINFIKSRPLNARLFLNWWVFVKYAPLCDGMGSEHTELLLHTDVRWLLRGKVLNRLFELRNELCCFLSDNASPLATLFKDNNWIAKLAYLADIFTKLNELNLSLQGRDTTILKLYDRVGGFLKKVALWKRLCAVGDFSCFLLFDSFVVSENMERDTVKTFPDGHLANVISSFKSYFPDVREKSEQLDWVRNPFTLSQSNRGMLPVHLREELLDLSTDCGLQTTFENCSLTEFWVCVRREHPELGKSTLEHLLPFGSTYLCETSFSAMTQIKTKQNFALKIVCVIMIGRMTSSPMKCSVRCTF